MNDKTTIAIKLTGYKQTLLQLNRLLLVARKLEATLNRVQKHSDGLCPCKKPIFGRNFVVTKE